MASLTTFKAWLYTRIIIQEEQNIFFVNLKRSFAGAQDGSGGRILRLRFIIELRFFTPLRSVQNDMGSNHITE